MTDEAPEDPQSATESASALGIDRGAEDGFVRTLPPEAYRVSPEMARRLLPQAAMVRNAYVAAALHRGDRFQFRGRVFHVPPVSYPEGVVLQALARELSERVEVAEADISLESLMALRATTVEVAERLYACLMPVTRWDKMSWRWRANFFLYAEAPTQAHVRELQRALHDLLGLALTVPDEIDRRHVVSEQQQTPPPIDCADELCRFVVAYGATPWVRGDGVPCCWRHFRLGLTAIYRAEARDQLRQFASNLMVQVEPAVRTKWVAEHQAAAGWV